MINFKKELIDLARQMETELDSAYTLWTWLPSHKAAVKHHGDYASDFTPSVRDILIEASMFISHNLNPSSEQRSECEFYKCPCGEDVD